MRKILVGQFDRLLGTVALDSQENWILEPLPDVIVEELQATLDSVFVRFQRRQKNLTRPQFLQNFTRKRARLPLRMRQVLGQSELFPQHFSR